MAADEPADEPAVMYVERTVKEDGRTLLLYTWPDDDPHDDPDPDPDA